MYKGIKKLVRSDDWSVNKPYQKNQFSRRLRNLFKKEIVAQKKEHDKFDKGS